MNWPSAALAVALFVLQAASGSGSISGSVLKAGTTFPQPIQNARLELTGAGTPIVIRSDKDGRFVFANLPPGQYRLSLTSDGFIRQESRKTIVLGRGQQAGNILFELEAAPTAAGQVLDSFGEPVADILVEALRRTYDVRGNPRLTLAAAAVTDDRGEYRIFWLDPGSYFFSASSALPEGNETQSLTVFPPTYSPGVTTPEDAKPLRLDIGRETHVDFRMARRVAQWIVDGHTASGVTNRPASAAITLTPLGQDASSSQYHAQSSAGTGPAAGEFSMGKVPPGSYILMAKSGSGDFEIDGFRRIVLRPTPYAQPPVRPPELSVFLTLSRPLSLSGRMFVESREAVDLRQANVSLLAADPDMPSPQGVSARPDGQFTLNGIVPGNYVLDISNLPQDLYLKAAQFKDSDILEKPLAVDTGETANPIQILLNSNGGRLQAAAYNSKSELHAGAQFVLVPDAGRRGRRDQYRLAVSGEDGLASLRGIPPGNYTLFAWEELEPNGYLNADYVQAYESFGVPVKIASGDNPPVSVRLIPRE